MSANGFFVSALHEWNTGSPLFSFDAGALYSASFNSAYENGIHEVSVPILADFHAVRTTNANLFLFAGPSVGYVITSESTSPEYFATYKMSHFEIGLDMGVGITLWDRLQLRAGYSQELLNLDKNICSHLYVGLFYLMNSK